MGKERTGLYRLYSAEGNLLYVGITSDPARRFSQHAGEKKWWPQVVRRDVEWYETRDGALAAEEAAIRSKQPVWNELHSTLQSPITASLDLNVYQVTGLDILSRQFGTGRDDTIAILLVRELAARGLLGEPPCYCTAFGWPDGVKINPIGGGGEGCPHDRNPGNLKEPGI